MAGSQAWSTPRQQVAGTPNPPPQLRRTEHSDADWQAAVTPSPRVAMQVTPVQIEPLWQSSPVEQHRCCARPHVDGLATSAKGETLDRPASS